MKKILMLLFLGCCFASTLYSAEEDNLMPGQEVSAVTEVAPPAVAEVKPVKEAAALEAPVIQEVKEEAVELKEEEPQPLTIEEQKEFLKDLGLDDESVLPPGESESE